VQAWRDKDNKYLQMLKDLSNKTDLYKHKASLYMFVGVALTIEYVCQELNKVKPIKFREVDQEFVGNVRNDKLVRRALLQGILCNILDHFKLNVESVKHDEETHKMTTGNSIYEAFEE
jgi:hypothetical protein